MEEMVIIYMCLKSGNGSYNTISIVNIVMYLVA